MIAQTVKRVGSISMLDGRSTERSPAETLARAQTREQPVKRRAAPPRRQPKTVA